MKKSMLANMPLSLWSVACVLSGVTRLYSVDLPVSAARIEGTCAAANCNGRVLMQAKTRSIVDPVPGLDRSFVGKTQDPLWGQAWASVQNFTMEKEERAKFMYDAVKLMNRLGVEGDIVEAGVWKGGVSMTMALAQLRTREGKDRHLWLYDTYQGLPAPSSAHDGEEEKTIWNRIHEGDASEMAQHPSVNRSWNYAAEDGVRQNLALTGFPSEKVHFIKGKVEDTLLNPSNLPEKIAILRLDTDWYDSTKAELAHLLPRLQDGGLLFIDDYCSWQGSREATDEFFATVTTTSLQVQEPYCAFAWKPSGGFFAKPSGDGSGAGVGVSTPNMKLKSLPPSKPSGDGSGAGVGVSTPNMKLKSFPP